MTLKTAGGTCIKWGDTIIDYPTWDTVRGELGTRYTGSGETRIVLVKSGLGHSVTLCFDYWISIILRS